MGSYARSNMTRLGHILKVRREPDEEYGGSGKPKPRISSPPDCSPAGLGSFLIIGERMSQFKTNRFIYLFLAAVTAPAVWAQGSGAVTYASPSCGPAGGSTYWACGAWPSATAPALGAAGTVVSDPDSGNRVLRVTESGSFGEAASTAFKGFDSGWKRAWNANSTRFIVMPWAGGSVLHSLYWVGFDPATMALTTPATPVPGQIADAQWDQTNPDLIVGLVSGVATTYNVITKVFTKVYDPKAYNWGGVNPWMAVWGGDTVCIAGGGQDIGLRVTCFNRRTSVASTIFLPGQTINGSKFPVYFQGSPVTLPSSVTVHSINLGMDGRWLAIDTHGNSMCSVPGIPNYSGTALFLDLQTKIGYEWNIACGGTHWAYGFDGVMMQSGSPRWSSTGADSPCNSDSRGVLRRNTDQTVDSSVLQTGACSFYNPATWDVNVHLSWDNNLAGPLANTYPVLMATTTSVASKPFLFGEIAAVETTAAPYQGRLWRFAQTWNDPVPSQCGFLEYSSPSISPDGKWAIFPSDWNGQTGSNGVCTNNKRTDLFVFELK